MPRDWNEYYASDPAAEKPPEPLLVRAIQGRTPGRALDIACGLGRNALYLAAQGWEVSAVDSSRVAIDILRESASEGLSMECLVADLEAGEFAIQADSYDLIVACNYLHRPLFPSIRDGVKRGGLFAGVFPMSGINPAFLMHAGEGRTLFEGWALLHYEEGARAEIIAEKT